MDRRLFLKAAVLTAGGLAIEGCGEDRIQIPCLPVADIPAVAGMTYIKASEIGCALDCDLSTGRNRHTGGAATDDAPRINQALAEASASKPITLILDGPASISGLFLPAQGYWSIIGQGCTTGFYIRTGTNNDGIHNGGPTANQPNDPGPPAPPRGANVTLANFAINGNRGSGRNGVSTMGAAQGIMSSAGPNLWYFPINLMNLDNIQVINVAVVNSPAYHVRFSNCGKVRVTGCVLRSSGASTDGLHFNGPANDITISNCQFTTDDDAIALNCPEGYTGDIENVVVTDCTFSGWSLMRMNTIPNTGDWRRSYIRNVSVSRCTAHVELAAFLLGQGSTALSESVSGVTISDCTITGPAVLEIGVNFGTVELENVRFITDGGRESPGYAIARTSPFFLGSRYSGTQLQVSNCTIQRSSHDDAVALFLMYGSSIKNLVIDGLVVEDSYPAIKGLINVGEGTLGTLTLDSVQAGRIAGPVVGVGLGAVGEVSGSGRGVLNTNWKFPDAIMADGVPYLSATTGLPAIKVNGVVEPF